MITAARELDTVSGALDGGAADYLIKPCSPDQLRIAVARQLDTRRMLDRLDSLEREARPAQVGVQFALPEQVVEDRQDRDGVRRPVQLGQQLRRGREHRAQRGHGVGQAVARWW